MKKIAVVHDGKVIIMERSLRAFASMGAARLLLRAGSVIKFCHESSEHFQW